MSDERDAGIEIGLSGGGWLTYRGEYGEGVGWLRLGRVRGVSSEALGGLLEVRIGELGIGGGLSGLPPVVLERPGMLSELKSAVCDAAKLALVWPGGVLLRMGEWQRLMTKEDSVADVVREWMSGSGLSVERGCDATGVEGTVGRPLEADGVLVSGEEEAACGGVVLSEREEAVLESVGLTFEEAQVLMKRVVDAYREMGAAFRDATAAFVEAARGFLPEAPDVAPKDPAPVECGHSIDRIREMARYFVDAMGYNDRSPVMVDGRECLLLRKSFCDELAYALKRRGLPKRPIYIADAGREHPRYYEMAGVVIRLEKTAYGCYTAAVTKSRTGCPALGTSWSFTWGRQEAPEDPLVVPLGEAPGGGVPLC